jgi:cell division protein FtsL
MVTIALIVSSICIMALMVKNRFLVKKNKRISAENDLMERQILRIRNEKRSLSRKADAWDLYIKGQHAKRMDEVRDK